MASTGAGSHHLCVQLPRGGVGMECGACTRLWQHRHLETIGKNPADGGCGAGHFSKGGCCIW